MAKSSTLKRIDMTITRILDDGTDVEIKADIDAESGDWSQWGQPTEVLGGNVDLIEALTAAAMES